LSLDDDDVPPVARTSANDDGLSLASLELADGDDDPLGALTLLDDDEGAVLPVALDDDGAAAPSASPRLSLSDDGLGLDDGGMLQLDDDVAALAAQLDALDAAAPRSQVRDLDFIDYSDAPDAPPAAPAVAPSAAPTAPKPVPVATRPAPPSAPAAPERKSSFGDLDLAPLEEEAAPVTVARAASSYDFSSLNFSLEPTSEELEEAEMAPPVATPASAVAPATKTTLDPLLAAMDLAPSRPAKRAQDGPIPRIIVLGASIGGPDALRSFLGGIPEEFPALFVLAQHLENAFFERLAQQLQKASKLPVRVPEQGARARAGEVLVVPANKRVRIERDGAIALADCPTPPKYTPCIDDVMRDAADRFGADATAIIFSGMAGDAIEGAVYLTSLGGEVWAQDPASCVVSSMVDGARARGVVEFVGSPRELADHCVARYGQG
jgi:chemotaxis response regulator CheB